MPTAPGRVRSIGWRSTACPPFGWLGRSGQLARREEAVSLRGRPRASCLRCWLMDAALAAEIAGGATVMLAPYLRGLADGAPAELEAVSGEAGGRLERSHSENSRNEAAASAAASSYMRASWL